MAPASLSLQAPTTSFPFSTSAGGRSRPQWSPTMAPAPLPPAATPAVPRRLLLPAAAGIWDFISGGAAEAAAASLAVRQGMQLFRQGDVVGSLAQFDRAIELDPRQKQYLWQRGLSLYYLDRFEEGAEQFRLDVAANPDDTEESIWCFLCEAQLYGIEEARKRFLEVGLDSRPVMREAYSLFKDGGDPEKLVSNFLSGSGGEAFYSSLYAGLYYESQKDADMAKSHIVAACKSPYGSSLVITWLHLRLSIVAVATGTWSERNPFVKMDPAALFEGRQYQQRMHLGCSFLMVHSYIQTINKIAAEFCLVQAQQLF